MQSFGAGQTHHLPRKKELFLLQNSPTEAVESMIETELVEPPLYAFEKQKDMSTEKFGA